MIRSEREKRADRSRQDIPASTMCVSINSSVYGFHNDSHNNVLLDMI